MRICTRLFKWFFWNVSLAHTFYLNPRVFLLHKKCCSYWKGVKTFIVIRFLQSILRSKSEKRANSKVLFKSVQNVYIFLLLIWFFQTLFSGLNINVWQEINCQRKKIKFDFRFPIKATNSTFYITWLLISY